MTEREVMHIRGAFYRFVLEDPYPELTSHERTPSFLRRFMPQPERVSPHKAWMDGFNFAKRLIEDALNCPPKDEK